MFNIVDKVQKLIAMTTSSFEEEARNAAMQACRLIREHRLMVVDYIPPPKPKISKVKPRYHDFPMEIKTKFHSQRCVHCGRVCEHETPVLWLRGVGVTHLACREYWEIEEASI